MIHSVVICMGFLLFLGTTQCTFAQGGATLQEPIAPVGISIPKVVAVLPFESLKERTATNTGKMAGEFITTALARFPTFKVVERTRIEHVLNEMEFGASQSTTGGNAQKLGQMVGADTVVVGTVSEFESDLRLDARLVSVADGAILATGTAFAQRGIESLSRASDTVASQLNFAAIARATEAKAMREAAGRGLAVSVLSSSKTNQPRALVPGDVMRSGEYYKLVLTPSRDGHAYVIQVDAKGNVFQLFPREELSGKRLNNMNPLIAGQPRELPGPGKSFVLDDVKGQERILVFFGPEQDMELETLLTSLDQAERAKDKAAGRRAGESLKQTARVRGVKGAIEDGETSVSFGDSAQVSKVAGRVFVISTEKGAFEFEFQHN